MCIEELGVIHFSSFKTRHLGVLFHKRLIIGEHQTFIFKRVFDPANGIKKIIFAVDWLLALCPSADAFVSNINNAYLI